LTDGLGSAALTTVNSVSANQFRATFYGNTLLETNNSEEWPRFCWFAQQSIRRSDVPHAEFYDRTRVYSSTEARRASAPTTANESTPYTLSAFFGAFTGGSGTTDTCAAGTDNRKGPPPNCSKCPPIGSCKAVFITCFDPSPGKDLAVHPMSAKSTCGGCSCCYACTYDTCAVPGGDPVRNWPLSTPPFAYHSWVCLHHVPGSNLAASLKPNQVNTIGCGPQQCSKKHGNTLPVPDVWMDWGYCGLPSGQDLGWRCVCASSKGAKCPTPS
jgi:hypothetical protein